MTKPLISIVVPVYNLEAYIEKTLDSIFGQTHENIEVITVNDGSKDSTAKILDEYSKKEPRLVVIHKGNEGVTKARLSGIRVANGEYIGFVDGDDLIDADMYERLYNNAKKYNADISHCGYRVICQGGNVKYKYNSGKVVLQDRSRGIIDLLEGKFIEPGLCNKLYKKQLFSDILSGDTLFDDSLIINEDLLMNYFLFKASELSIYEDFCPYQYIKREGSASQSESRLCDYEHPIRVRQIILKDCTGTEFEDIARITYVSKTLHKISQIYEKKGSVFHELKNEMVEIIRANEAVLNRLSLKQKISSILILKFPFLFSIINTIYHLCGE